MKLDNPHLIFFDFEVFIEDWLVVFSTEETEEVIVNDCEKLKQFISSHSDYYFTGFNNYHYDDIIFHKILEGENPYKYNELIINGNNKSVDLKISDASYLSYMLGVKVYVSTNNIVADTYNSTLNGAKPLVLKGGVKYEWYYKISWHPL